MKALALVAIAAAGGALVLVATATGKEAPPPRGEITIHVVEHATTDAVTDTGAKGDSAGDVLTFANELFDRTNTRHSGHDQGFCVRTVAGAAWECWWTAFLAGGQITVEGPFYDARNSRLAVTGGTGVYAKARGWMQLRSRAAGTQFDFIYHLTLTPSR